MFSRIALVLLVLGMLAGGTLLAKDAPKGKPLTKAEITHLLGPHSHGAILDVVIMTQWGREQGDIVLAGDGQSFFHWLDPDSGSGGQDSGRWRIVDDTLCIKWDIVHAGAEICHRMYQVGDNAYDFRKADTGALTMKYYARKVGAASRQR